MKITKVTVIRANRGVYCKIVTDEGITGLGESGAWGFQEASAAAIKTFGEYLTGKDPMEIEHHWQYLYRFSHFRGAAIMGALSAVDIALWDIKGKALGVPVWQLRNIRHYKQANTKRRSNNTGDQSHGHHNAKINRIDPHLVNDGKKDWRHQQNRRGSVHKTAYDHKKNGQHKHNQKRPHIIQRHQYICQHGSKANFRNNPCKETGDHNP